MIDFVAKQQRIYANGNEWTIKGISWFGMETQDRMLHGTWGQLSLEHGLDLILQFGFNAIRLPFAMDSVLENFVLTDTKWESWSIGLTYIQALQYIIEKAAQKNLLILLDHHRLKADGDIEQLWYTDTMNMHMVMQGWMNLIDTFKNTWNVFAVDIYNEPHGIAEWGTGNKLYDWKLAAESISNRILEKCPRWLIFIQGVEKNIQGSPHVTSGWWGGNLQGIVDHPIQLIDPTKLVYAPHVYGPSVYLQDAFLSTDFPNNLTSIWDQAFGKTQQPIIIGEWGGTYKDTDQVWQDTFMNYLVKNNIGFFYWCLNPNSHDTGGVLLDDWQTPHPGKLQMLSKCTSNLIRY